jgi:hypothetical protein
MTPRTPTSFYVQQGEGTFLPTSATAGAWHENTQHGGPPAALLGRAIERLHPDDKMQVAHFSLDFLGPASIEQMAVRSECVRAGKRVELIGAQAAIDGRPVLRASAWRVAFANGQSPQVGLEDDTPVIPAQESRDFLRPLAMGMPSNGGSSPAASRSAGRQSCGVACAFR